MSSWFSLGSTSDEVDSKFVGNVCKILFAVPLPTALPRALKEDVLHQLPQSAAIDSFPDEVRTRDGNWRFVLGDRGIVQEFHGSLVEEMQSVVM